MALIVEIKKQLPNFDLEMSFSCKDGELNVLIGPSGAGKTTLIRIIAGLVRADEGKITYNGQTWVDTQKGVHLPTQKRRLGFVFQEYTLFPHLNVFKNVAFAADDEKQVEGLLRRFGIWHIRHAMPQKISGGEQQRCAICQNLARHPELLLLDEPFSALDVGTRRRLREGLKNIKKDLNIPIIHVTHDLSEALFLGDKVLPIVRGKKAAKWLQQHIEEGIQNDIQTKKIAGEFLDRIS
jgi:molybdate transport system ATP-binding protein